MDTPHAQPTRSTRCRALHIGADLSTVDLGPDIDPDRAVSRFFEER
jgi:hypothetical protein